MQIKKEKIMKPQSPEQIRQFIKNADKQMKKVCHPERCMYKKDSKEERP